MRILLVEDNPGDTRLIQEMIREVEAEQFEVTHVESLGEALHHVTKETFEIILLDLGLPDSQGIETFNRMYAKARMVPIVILTGLADEAFAITAMRQGAQDYLSKNDVEANLLVRALRYAIERKRLEERMRLTAELTKAIGSSLDINDVTETFARGIKRMVDYDQITITLVEEGSLRFAAASSSEDTEFVDDAVVPLSGTATEWVIKNKCPNIEKDFAKEMQFPFDEIHYREGLMSAIRLPLFSKGEVFGTLNLNSRTPGAYGEREQEILEEFTGQIATAIKNDRLLTEAKRRIQELEIAYRQLADRASASAKGSQASDETKG